MVGPRWIIRGPDFSEAPYQLTGRHASDLIYPFAKKLLNLWRCFYHIQTIIEAADANRHVESERTRIDLCYPKSRVSVFEPSKKSKGANYIISDRSIGRRDKPLRE